MRSEKRKYPGCTVPKLKQPVLNTFFERDQRELVPGYIEQEAREEESAAHKQGLS